MKLKLVNLAPLNEYGDYDEIQDLKDRLSQLYREMEQEAEPEGGPISDQYADEISQLEKEIESYEGGPKKTMTYGDMLHKNYPKQYGPGGVKRFSTVKPNKDAFNKSTKFDRMNEATEKAWNALDVSRKAEKEIDNKEWNTRTTKKLDMLKSLNKAGKFKKDWDEEKLQGWVDQNYSWEKLTRQFKLNEIYSAMYEQGTIKKVVNLKMDSEVGEPVTVEYAPGTNLTDVTISWGNESHTVDFEAGDVIDDHGNEGMDIETMADSDDGRWQFILDVQVEASFPMTGDFADWDFDELIVQGHPDNEDHLEPEDRSDYQNEGSCGYSQEAPDGKELDTPGGMKSMPADTRTMTMMREAIRKEIQKLSEADPEAIKGKHYPDEETVKNLKKGPYSPGGQNAQQESLEDKLKGAFSPEEMDKINSKPVPGFADVKPKERKSKFKKAGEQMGFDMRGLK